MARVSSNSSLKDYDTLCVSNVLEKQNKRKPQYLIMQNLQYQSKRKKNPSPFLLEINFTISVFNCIFSIQSPLPA